MEHNCLQDQICPYCKIAFCFFCCEQHQDHQQLCISKTCMEFQIKKLNQQHSDNLIVNLYQSIQEMQGSLNKYMNYITDTWPELFIVDAFSHNNPIGHLGFPDNKGFDSLEFDNYDQEFRFPKTIKPFDPRKGDPFKTWQPLQQIIKNEIKKIKKYQEKFSQSIDANHIIDNQQQQAQWMQANTNSSNNNSIIIKCSQIAPPTFITKQEFIQNEKQDYMTSQTADNSGKFLKTSNNENLQLLDDLNKSDQSYDQILQQKQLKLQQLKFQQQLLFEQQQNQQKPYKKFRNSNYYLNNSNYHRHQINNNSSCSNLDNSKSRISRISVNSPKNNEKQEPSQLIQNVTQSIGLDPQQQLSLQSPQKYDMLDYDQLVVESQKENGIMLYDDHQNIELISPKKLRKQEKQAHKFRKSSQFRQNEESVDKMITPHKHYNFNNKYLEYDYEFSDGNNKYKKRGYKRSQLSERKITKNKYIRKSNQPIQNNFQEEIQIKANI